MGYEEFVQELLDMLPRKEGLELQKENVHFYEDGWTSDNAEDLDFIRETNMKYHKTESDKLLGDFILLKLGDEVHHHICRFSCRYLHDSYRKEGWKFVWEVIRDNVELVRSTAVSTVTALLEENNYQKLRDRLFIRPLNYQENKYDLKTAVYRRVGDIVLVLYILVDEDLNKKYNNLMSVKLQRSQLKDWEESEDEVFDNALDNTYVMAPPRLFLKMEDVAKAPYERGCFMSEDSEITEILPMQVPLVTTTKQTNGAIALFYPGVKERIAELIGGDYYIAFTSIHEARIHKVGTLPPVQIARSLKNMNKKFGAEEALTGKAYVYEKDTGFFGIKEA